MNSLWNVLLCTSSLRTVYGVETKRLNEKVKRNPKRFAGENFMFQLTQEEYDDLRLRSQIATIKKGRGSHSKYLPHVFTLLGVSMLSSVLESDTAIEANRRIMRAFVTFHHIKTLPPADAYNELKQEIDKVRNEMNDILADQNDISLLVIHKFLVERGLQRCTPRFFSPHQKGGT